METIYKLFLLFLAVAGSGVGFEHFVIYQEEQQAYYEAKQQELYDFAETERLWFQENIGADGALYMNYTDNGARDVNPYFACFGMQGLLEYDPSEETMDLVADYLLWHREGFLEEDGAISDYIWMEDELIASGERDSVDSYVAVYLSLLCQYAVVGGNLQEVDADGVAFTMGMDVLQSLTKDGLTQVDIANETRYLMDNIEVQKAYLDGISCLETYGADWIGQEQTEQYLENIEVLYQENREAVEALWDADLGVYAVGLDGEGTINPFDGWAEKYPSAVGQIYEYAFIEETEITERMIQQYEMFSLEQDWENRTLTDAFPWAIIAYMAISAGDVEGVEVYLKKYEEEVAIHHDYPMYTGEVGWILKTCEKLDVAYQEIIEKDLIEIMEDWMKERLV